MAADRDVRAAGETAPRLDTATEHVDVLIIGAGLSGIGAACHLRRTSPRKSFALLEARAAIGGTWDLFRYPGVRSDSDMYTLGYSFRPWAEARAIADGASIREYVRDTAREYGIDDAIRFRHKAVGAVWSSRDARWTVTAARTGDDGAGRESTAEDDGAPTETVTLTCSFLFVCSGYYRYDEGYTPRFPGAEDFAGRIVHPQHWPQDLDYAGKRVVVIGSGATAVTLVPALAEQAAHVTMLQRSPTYVMSLPTRDPVADALRRILPKRVAHPALRWKNALITLGTYQLARRRPDFARSFLSKGAAKQLPAGYDVATHFSPAYAPWDQRLCIVPDGDLFAAVRGGRADVVTDQIETLTKTGVKLASGAELDADIVVTATGLNLLPIGGLNLAVDGTPVDLAETVAYKGMMLSGVPNFALAVGYTNASWTLKCDLVAHYVCRLLNHMDARGHRVCTPKAPELAAGQALDPLIDLQSGYVQRSVDQLPRQGPAAPWRLYQNYPRDVVMLRHRSVVDKGVEFA